MTAAAETAAQPALVTTWPPSPAVGMGRRLYSAAFCAIGYGCGSFADAAKNGLFSLIEQGLRVGLRADALEAVSEFEHQTGYDLTGQRDFLTDLLACEHPFPRDWAGEQTIKLPDGQMFTGSTNACLAAHREAHLAKHDDHWQVNYTGLKPRSRA